MELIIIVLIAVEVVFVSAVRYESDILLYFFPEIQVLVREGTELSHKIGDLIQSLLTPIKAIDGTVSTDHEEATQKLERSDLGTPTFGGSPRESRLV